MTTNPATRPFWVFAGSGIDVKEGVVVVECCFASYDEFLTEYQTYRFDECCELVETDLTCTIEGRILHFSPILVLRCKRCGNEFLPKHTKQMIDGTYRTAVKENQTIGEFYPTGYKKKFEYCTEQNYEYDHRDYYNIPGLCYDEEHSVEGFLTPVYFEKEALVFFLAMPEYEVEILSESYGYIAKKDSSGLYQYDWNIPFGFNTNGKLIMWLGDIDGMDDKTKGILKPFNIPSDHLLIDSEFYQAQMKCVFSEPIIEKRILINKEAFISNIRKKYSVDLSHLTDECQEHEKKVKRPVVFTETAVAEVINAYDKILIEGFNVSEMRKLYEVLYPIESFEIVGVVIGGAAKAISSIRSRSSNSARNTTQQVDSSAANTSIVEKVADIVEKTNRSLPCENDVSGHKQRYHTKNGVIWKNKAPYHRGGNNG